MSTTPSNPVQSCQPSSMELVTTLRDMRTPLACAAADRIEYLEATEANKIATLTARVEELTFQLDTSRLSVHNAEVENDRRADRIEDLEKALEAYEAAVDEAEAIFGGEYADNYGPMFELAMKARDKRRAVLQPKGTV